MDLTHKKITTHEENREIGTRNILQTIQTLSPLALFSLIILSNWYFQESGVLIHLVS